jgi:hypothetical protein
LESYNERSIMTRRIRVSMIALGALAALALGGAAFASAQSPSTTGHARTHVADRDNIQSGDQTTPDRATGKKAASETTGAENPEQPGTGSESPAGSDGPGGHADEPGNANADHQFQGNE